ncbi:MAG: carbohydrate ABC transporter permease [Spirochaetia bacterium]
MSTSASATTAAPLTLQQKKVRSILAGIPLRLTVLALVVIWTVPTLGLLVSSFRPAAAIRNTGWWTAFLAPFTADWTLANYIQVIGADRMGLAFGNSLLVTIPSTIIPITIAAFAAFALAWISFPGRKFVFVIVVGLMVVPLQMSLIPVLRVYTDLRLTGTYLGMWLAHTGFGLPLATYLLYGYIASIPKEILESAHADGATPMLTFTRLILPLSVPAVASFAIFQFLWVWNDLLVALVFLGTRSSNVIVTTRLAELVGSRGQDWHVLTSGAFLTIIVPLFVFLSLQRFFVRGMMAGSVKG